MTGDGEGTTRLVRARLAAWGWWLTPLLLALLAMSTAWALGHRGHTLWSLWLVQQAEALAAATDRASLREAYRAGEGVFPLVSRLVSRVSDSPEAALNGLRVFAVGLWVSATVLLGQAVGRVRTGVLAAVFLLLIPRFWTHATVAGPTIFAVAAAAWMMMTTTWLVRFPARGFGFGVVAVACALFSSLSSWWLLVPAFGILFVQGASGPGGVQIRPTTLWALAVLPVGAALGLLVHDGLGHRSPEGVGLLLDRWLERPNEPFLYAGMRYGEHRAPWWAALVFWGFTLPLPVLLASTAGVADAWSRMRSRPIVLWVVAAATLPWVFATIWLAGVDQLAMGLTPLAVLSAIGAERLARAARAWQPSRAWMPGAVVATLLVGAIPATLRTHGYWESYGNALVGGTARVPTAGFSRFAHGPVPYAVARAATAPVSEGEGSRPARVSVVSNAWEWRPVLEHYRATGVVDADWVWAGPNDADRSVMIWEDALPEVYEGAPRWLRARATQPVRRFGPRDLTVIELIGPP